MITISAFADEISADLNVQMDVCESHGIKCIDVRGIDGKNCSKFTIEEAKGYRKRMADRGFRMPCLGSPIGKIRVDEPMEPHLELLKHCIEVSKAMDCNLIRMFSFYPPKDGNVLNHRAEVMDRIAAMVKVAEGADMVLMHENEAEIYGSKAQQVIDIFQTITSPRLKGIYDPANYVTEQLRPYDQAWVTGVHNYSDFFHIKDKKFEGGPCVPIGQGDGQVEAVFRDIAKWDFSGYMTLEPHMKVAGKSGGETGADLFALAVGALKGMLEKFGMKYC